MTIKDRRNKSYNWNAWYDCPNGHVEWPVKMEFNNGRNFQIDDKRDRFCPKCGTEGERIDAHEALTREQERRSEARREREVE